MKKRILPAVVLFGFLCTLLFVHIFAGQPRLGVYSTADKTSYFILKEGNSFDFVRYAYMSYIPQGTYTYQDGRLSFCTSQGEEDYAFIKKGRGFSIEKGIEDVVPDGVVYTYQGTLE